MSGSAKSIHSGDRRRRPKSPAERIPMADNTPPRASGKLITIRGAREQWESATCRRFWGSSHAGTACIPRMAESRRMFKPSAKTVSPGSGSTRYDWFQAVAFGARSCESAWQRTIGRISWRRGMAFSPVEVALPRAFGVSVGGDALSADLSDGRTAAVPIAWYPRLSQASKHERGNWRLTAGGASFTGRISTRMFRSSRCSKVVGQPRVRHRSSAGSTAAARMVWAR